MTREREDALYTFVNRDIFVNQSSLVEEAFKKELFIIEDVENIYRPFDGKLIDPVVCVKCQNNFGCLDSETGECEACFEANQQPQEIYEWWIVSPWFGEKLLIEGQPVLKNGYGVWWGRCATGQSITLDYVIEKIYDDVMSY